MEVAEAVIFKPGDLISMQNDKAGSHSAGRESSALFESVFKTHFKNLYIYACSIVKDDIMAEEVVQNVFYKLWEKKEQIHVQQSIKSYLYRAVHNESVNYLRHVKVRANYQAHAAQTNKDNGYMHDNATLKELQQKIDIALGELPEQCRTIFQLSRYEELNYREIADKLDISISTVKNQVGKALRVLRSKLSEFLPLIIFFIVYLKKLV